MTIDITNPNVSGPNGGVANGALSVVNNWVPGASLSLLTNYGGNYLFGLLGGGLYFANSYMGFRVGSGPNYNYGWIEVTWSGSTNTFEILAAAYESQANTAILAGDVGSVSAPAPSPASLLALIVGGAALRQWRQRRRARQPVATACT